MSPHEPFDDPVLGRVVWDEDRKGWSYEVSAKSGQKIRGLVDPTDEGLLESAKGLDETRALVRWVVEHELNVRQRITDAMFPGWLSDWYDQEIDTVTTPEGFRATIRLAGMYIHTMAYIDLTYNDGNLFGGHMIVLCVDSEGRFVHGPAMWG